MTKRVRVGFLGAGGIAQSHVYALDVLKHYYSDAPTIEKVAVASPTPESRTRFAIRFGFQKALPPDAIWEQEDIDTLYILGPNHTHTTQLLKAAEMHTIQRIYVEKPIGSSREDIDKLVTLEQSQHGKFIMMGFQYLQKSSLRKALAHWQSGVFGTPIHFRTEYLHSSYLDPTYRQKRPHRLQPTPIDGAAADLGSHVLSLLTAFLGDALIIRAAAASGRYDDVPPNSDLCTTALIEETVSGAVGTMVASRVSAGTGDFLSLTIHGTRGAISFDTSHPDCYETFLPDEGWRRHEVNSDYLPASKFPSDYAPSGWLRALVHNHYLFLGGDPGADFIPDLAHGIRVQELLQEIADQLLIKS